MSKEKIEWVYYLNLDGNLNRHFFDIDQHFKNVNVTLIPISIDQLLTMSQEISRVNVICCVTSIHQRLKYLKKNNRIVKMLLKNKRINLYLISSYQNIDVQRGMRRVSNYTFLQLPVNLRDFSDQVSQDIKDQIIADSKVRFYNKL